MLSFAKPSLEIAAGSALVSSFTLVMPHNLIENVLKVHKTGGKYQRTVTLYGKRKKERKEKIKEKNMCRRHNK